MLVPEILILNTSWNLESLVSCITARGWLVHEAQDTETAKKLIHDHKLSIGIVVFHNIDVVRSLGFGNDNIFGYSKFQWLALISKPILESESISCLIGEYFYDYLTFPPDIDRLLVIMGHALGMARLSRIEKTHPQNSPRQSNIVGESDEMLKFYRALRKIARVNLPALIIGESGTGKELAALEIHRISKRADQKFVVVNCGTLSPNLVHSELFGHEKGAFTGATERKIGHIEGALGGTLFLDEIGELPLDLQVILLRFLQEKNIQRVGGSKVISIDTRVVAATNVDLEKAVEKDSFREDLYYRLNVLRINMPPLRQRGDDIELLARYFFDQFADEKSKQLKGFSLRALWAINSHNWPGNVRELMNRVRSAMVMSENRLISPEDLGLEQLSQECPFFNLNEARHIAEKQTIQKALRSSQKNITRTAQMLGVSRVTLYRLMEKTGINL